MKTNFFRPQNQNIRFERDIKNIILMAVYDEQNETINNETIQLSTFNESSKSQSLFEIVYHSVKDLIEARS